MSESHILLLVHLVCSLGGGTPCSANELLFLLPHANQIHFIQVALCQHASTVYFLSLFYLHDATLGNNILAL